MKRNQTFLFFLSLLTLIPGTARGQAWSGIIAPSRAVDWSQAGIPGGIPTRTTQCGSTIAAYSGSATAINTAITNCTAGQYVSLGAGTFNLTSGIQWNGKSNVTLRGQGANSTFLVFTGAGAGHYNSVIAMEPSSLNEGNDAEQNVCDWTAGYAQGTTVITLANCGSTSPAVGSLSNLKVGSILMLDQLDEVNDTGTLWNCTAGVSEGGPQCANNPTGSGGEPRHDGTCNTSPAECYRSQRQGVIITSINGANITTSPGLYMPNWRTGQKPQAWFATSPITGDGLENLSIDTTTVGAGAGQTILVGNCDQCYVDGVRSIMANRSHIRSMYSTRFIYQSNYFYENVSHNTVSYGLEMWGGWNGIVANNIFQQNSDSEPSCSGSCEGNVVAYNLAVDDTYNSAGWMQASNYEHASGSAYNLWEGNIGPGYTSDDVHGTHAFDTVYRNYLYGNQNAGCGSAGVNTCTAQTIPINMNAGSRYYNIIGNVLGRSGYHSQYQCNATSTASCSNAILSIYNFGFTGNSGAPATAVSGFCTSPSCGSTSYYDPQVGAYVMRWGNYDVVTGLRWCGNSSDTGWTTTCSDTSEIPTTLASYSNPVPTLGDTGAGQSPMPASFYLSSKPSYFGSISLPLIGPDVSNGNVGVCSGGAYADMPTLSSSQCGNGGTLATGLGGHVNAIPAMVCYLNVMNGPADGTGSVRSFDANACYGQQVGSQLPAPPTNLNAVIQ